MAYPLINGAPINGTDSTASWSVGNIVETGTAASALRATAAGDQPWVFGQFRVQSGTDVEFSPFGMSLVRSGLHSAIAAQPPATVDVQAAGARPMVLGDLTAVLAPITVDAGGASPMAIGGIFTAFAAQAGGADALDLGGISVAISAYASGTSPMSVGHASAVPTISPAGMRLGVAGMAVAFAATVVVGATGAAPLVLGGFGSPYAPVRARQSFPMRLGTIALNRGTAC